jgi:hypothetical protein
MEGLGKYFPHFSLNLDVLISLDYLCFTSFVGEWAIGVLTFGTLNVV